MFSLQDSIELLLQESPVLPQDLIPNQDFSKTRNLATKSSKKRQRKSNSEFGENKDVEIGNDTKLRKMMHRDIERQRRQEMTGLYASLRTLLPLEYIKGKRSISDHVHEAVNYTKQLESNIKELRLRRDKLKKLYASGVLDKSVVLRKSHVTVSPCLGGVEILISCGLKEAEGFPVSRLLIELIQTGLSIVSCIHTKANGRSLYRIQFEVNDLAYINLPLLQQKLINQINFG